MNKNLNTPSQQLQSTLNTNTTTIIISEETVNAIPLKFIIISVIICVLPLSLTHTHTHTHTHTLPHIYLSLCLSLCLSLFRV